VTPYYHDEDSGITIYHGDCRVIVPRLGHYDVVLADIPYDVVSRQSQGLRNLDKGDADASTFDLQWVADHVATRCMSIYVWCGTEQVSDLRRLLVEKGKTTRLCVWEKSNPSPMNGDCLWLSSIECCVFGRAKRAPFSGHCESPVWRGPVEREQLHPTQKPVWLMRRLIEKSCPVGGRVLDFCCGSGTTLVAAKQVGCQAVGIEMNEAYCEIAANRLAQGVLFGPEVK
jgi:site-specific DNA-methyltransferase (adenine-specific)